ncbi:MAG: UDP-N-acetylmuramate--L-alanine ligase, partial [Burkholderiaceae bacterium]
TLKRLAKLNIKTYVGHSIDNLLNADVVVISSAVKNDNPEVIAARDKKIPIVPRAIMLAELMRMKQGIAVAGTHGKTTTTSLIASILAEAGLDPTFVIGGRLNSADANAKLGSGDYIVVEADESDASFLNLLPVMAVVTNIDADHMETYGHDFEKLKNAFVEFLHKMPFYGAAILCIDNLAIREIIPFLERPILSYGFSKEAKIFATNVDAVGGEMHFVVHRHNNSEKPELNIKLNLPGMHNVLNALAAIAVATELDIPDTAIQQALLQFKGVDRRFQNYGSFNAKLGGSFTLIDDYGHHPVEMRATIEAARGAFPNQRLVLAFQPHRYTRTRDCFEDFVKIISSVDMVLLAEVYSAGEAKIVGADGRALTRALRLFGKVDPLFIDEIVLMPEAIMSMAIDGDVVLCMGAGSIGSVPKIIMDQFNMSNTLIQKEASV